jgi:hypothetical protein
MLLSVRELSFEGGIAFVGVSGCVDCPLRRTEERTVVHVDAEGNEVGSQYDDYSTLYRCGLTRITVSSDPISPPPINCPLRMHVIAMSYPNIHSSDIKKVLSDLK